MFYIYGDDNIQSTIKTYYFKYIIAIIISLIILPLTLLRYGLKKSLNHLYDEDNTPRHIQI